MIGPTMNAEQQTLIKRLLEAGLDTKRFLKLNEEKAAFEDDWPTKLYTPEEMGDHPYWGICGRDGLVLADADKVAMDSILRQILPSTFEVRSPRRGLTHFYFVVEGDPVPNKTLHLKGEEEGCGEIRAQNYYLVAPGTEIHYRDLRTSEPKIGRYIIVQDRPFAKIQYADFMKAIEPYLGSNPKQPITFEQMRRGVAAGTRHAQGIKYANFLIGVQQFNFETALVEMKRWNQLNQPSISDEKDLARMVENAISYDNCGKRAKETKRTPLADYGFEIHKLKNKVYVLAKTGEADPLSTFSSLTSSLSKKAVADITKAPIIVVEKAFAILAVRLSAKTEAKNETETTKEEEEFNEETTREAWQLLRSPSLFYDIGPVFERGFEVPKINKTRFVLGEERNKRLLGPLLTGASILGMTSLIRVIGEPGTAKDTLVRMWLKLLGIEYLERSYLTAAAIRYSPNIKNVDLLYIPDTPKMQGETGRTMLFMRSDDGGLISEYATRDSETGKMTTETVTLPIKGVVTTSIEVIAGAALTSGMWTLTTDADLKLTESVKKEKLKLRAGKHGLLPDKDLDVWRCAFKILRTEELLEDPIIIEYAGNLDKIISSERSESRRDPDKLCDLICLVAWMRRFQKAEEDRGKADFTDLYIALQIGKDAIRETMSGLSVKEQKILDALIARIAPLGGVTIREISEETKIAHKTVYNILEQSLLEKGYATVEKEGNRNCYKYLTGKSGKSSPFSEGSNELKSDEIITFVSDVIGHYSSPHENLQERIILVDPVTGEQVTFERNGESVTGKAEPSKLFTPTGIGYPRSNGEPSPSQAATAEQTTKPSLPAEISDEKGTSVPLEEGKLSNSVTKETEKGFLLKRIQPCEPCEKCGEHPVEFEFENDNHTVRRCPSCIDKMRSEGFSFREVE